LIVTPLTGMCVPLIRILRLQIAYRFQRIPDVRAFVLVCVSSPLAIKLDAPHESRLMRRMIFGLPLTEFRLAQPR
jgi:hypothetical protein